jgi:micrococcal nuclease
VSKRARRQRRTFLFYLLLLGVGLLFFLYLNAGRLPSLSDIRYLFNQPTIDGLIGPVELVRVSDGDTIVVHWENKEESIRLIGVDTPEKFASDKLERDDAKSPLTKKEIQRLGKLASEYTSSLIDGKVLYLELDTEDRDRYRRLLAYVYFCDANGDYAFGETRFEQVNLELVKAGWATPLTIPPNVRYADDYVNANRVAQQENKGMWAEIP